MTDTTSATSPAGPACAATTCHRTLRDHELHLGQTICDPCLHTIRAWLGEIPRQIVVIEASLQRETTGTGGGRSAHHTAPLPGRDDTLNLLATFAWADDIRDPYGDAHGDQHGQLPIAGTLIPWVRLITEERRWNPRPSSPRRPSPHGSPHPSHSTGHHAARGQATCATSSTS